MATEQLHDLEATRKTLLALINEQCKEFRRRPLYPNSLLDAVAKRRAEDYLAYMAGNAKQPAPLRGAARSLIARSRKLTRELQALSYRVAAIVENTALGPRSPEAAVEAWMQNQKYRDSILDAGYFDSGIAVVWGETRQGPMVVWVLVLGRERGEDRYQTQTDSDPRPF